MDLQTFIDLERGVLEAFRLWYVKQHEINPQKYAVDLDLDEWDARISRFVNTRQNLCG
jgi:hypothetical protein